MDLLRAMRSFVAVADLGAFAAAARALSLSPPAVTRDVAALEQRFGCRLLQRTTRHVRLTEAGGRYLSDTKRILLEISEAEASIVGAHGDLRGPIAVTAPATFGRLHVGRHIVDFARRHPRIVFTTLFLDRLVDLVEEGVDVAVRIAHLQVSSATAIRVGSVRRILCAAPAYIAEHGEPRLPADLERMQVIDFAESQLPWQLQSEGRQKRTVRPPTRFIANSVDLAIEGASAGCGVVRLLSYQAAESLAAGRLQRVLERFEPDPVPVYVVHLEGRAAPKRTRSFIDFLVDELRRDPKLRD
jgi:DNA-binding transcriptional LysR family regulator